MRMMERAITKGIVCGSLFVTMFATTQVHVPQASARVCITISFCDNDHKFDFIRGLYVQYLARLGSEEEIWSYVRHRWSQDEFTNAIKGSPEAAEWLNTVRQYFIRYLGRPATDKEATDYAWSARYYGYNIDKLHTIREDVRKKIESIGQEDRRKREEEAKRAAEKAKRDAQRTEFYTKI